MFFEEVGGEVGGTFSPHVSLKISGKPYEKDSRSGEEIIEETDSRYLFYWVNEKNRILIFFYTKCVFRVKVLS